MDTSQMGQTLGWVVLVGGIVMGAREYRDNANHGFIEYSQVIKVGVLISVITAIFMGLFSLVYMEYINPEMMEQVILQQEERMIEQGASDEQIEMTVEYMRKFSNPAFSIPISVLIYGVVGLIISAIAGVFIKDSNNL